MDKTKIDYRTKTASEENIYLHLNECSANFIPDLNETVDIKEYSKKIFSKAITFEAWKENRLIGLVAAYMNDIETFSAYITSVSVTRDYFGSGVALQILSMAIQYAEKNHFSTLRLEVNKLNKVAVQLYEKYNFKIVEEKENSYLMKLDIH